MKNNTTKKAALYDPYLDVLGGGERHILSILQVLEQEGYDITIFWDTDLEEQIIKQLHIWFHNLRFENNIFQHATNLARLKKLAEFDTFFYVTDGSYLFSSARHNYVFCMVPQKKLYTMTVVNRIKTQNFRFLANSNFTHTWLKKWGISSSIIHPYIDDQFLNNNAEYSKKQNMILVVGRFFPQLHSKRHDLAITWFQELRKKYSMFNDYTLHLVGSMKQEDQLYFEDLQNLAGQDPSIHFHPNITFSELETFYKTSRYYWHFTGFDVNEQTEPEKTEHLGITPLEAMAAGCVVLAYDAGGPKELIIDGENGFLFHTQHELFEKMKEMEQNNEKRAVIQKQAHQYVDTTFSYRTFRKRVKEVIISGTT